MADSGSFWCLRLPLATANGQWGWLNLYRAFESEPMLVDMNYLSELFRGQLGSRRKNSPNIRRRTNNIRRSSVDGRCWKDYGLMNYVHTAEFSVTDERRAGRFASVVAKTIFVSLMVLIAFTAIPYGTVEPWWKAFFVCAVLAYSMLQLIESIVTGSWMIRGVSLLLPLISLTVFAFIQTLSISSPATRHSPSSMECYQCRPLWKSILRPSTSVFNAGDALLFRHVSNEKRLRVLINVIIGVAVASALFGIIRQTN